jgi:hypothetical protein
MSENEAPAKCPITGLAPSANGLCPEATRTCPHVGSVPAGSKCPAAKKTCPKGHGSAPAGSVCPKVKKVTTSMNSIGFFVNFNNKILNNQGVPSCWSSTSGFTL